jgi:hypothetical protein
MMAFVPASQAADYALRRGGVLIALLLRLVIDQQK